MLKPTKEQDETAFVSGEKTRAVNSLRPLSYQTEFSIQDLQSIVTSVVEQKLGELRRELKDPTFKGSTASHDYGSKGEIGLSLLKEDQTKHKGKRQMISANKSK